MTNRLIPLFKKCQELFPDETELCLLDLCVKAALSTQIGEELAYLQEYQRRGESISSQLLGEFESECALAISKDSDNVLFLWHHGAVEQPLISFYEQCQRHAEFHCIYGVTAADTLSEKALRYSKGKALFIPHNGASRLKDIRAVVSTDYFLPHDLPASVYRLAIVHGLILSNSWGILHFFINYLFMDFDGLFFSANLQQQYNPERYLGELPLAMKNTAAESFSIIQGGYAKLDRFIDVVERQNDLKVVIHLSSFSYIGVNTEQLNDVMQNLQLSIPGVQVCVRPFPGEEHLYADLKQQWSGFDIKWDRNSSYDQTYKDAAVLINFGSHTLWTFAVGTKRAAIDVRIGQGADVSEEEFGFTVRNIDALVSTVKKVLDGDPEVEKRIAIMREKLANPGKASTRMIRHLESVFAGANDAEYQYRYLSPGVSGTSVEEYIDSDAPLAARAEVAKFFAIEHEDFAFAEKALQLRLQYLGEKHLAKVNGFQSETFSDFLLIYLRLHPGTKQEVESFRKQFLPLIVNALLSGDSHLKFEACKSLMRKKLATLGREQYLQSVQNIK